MKTNTKRTTVYLDSDLHRALRLKAAETEHSMSQLVQDAILKLLERGAAHVNERGRYPARFAFVLDLLIEMGGIEERAAV